MIALIFLFFAQAQALPFAPIDVGGARQIIYVQTGKSFLGEVSLYQRKENLWIRALGPWPAVVGRSGSIAPENKKEGDGFTPTGLYKVGFSFGKVPKSEAKLLFTWPYKQMTQEDKWIDDPKSPHYNQLVHGKTEAKSFEVMTPQSGVYDLGLVVEYNTRSAVPGKGSAIFLHIWENSAKGTAGCIALAKENVEAIVKWLEAGTDARILIDEKN